MDEIHLFDTAGAIYAGTVPAYFGYNVDSGEQMRFFKPMLSDRTLSLCQDVTPNTAEGKMMMYAMVWREDGQGLVQIGISPTRLLEQMEQNKAENILSGILTSTRIYFVADHATGNIVGCTQTGYQGQSLQTLGLPRSEFSEEKSAHFDVKLGGTAHLAAFKVCGGYEVGICQPRSSVYKTIYLSSAIILMYLLCASVVIVSMVGFMERKEREKEREHQSQLENALKQVNAANEAKSVFLANMSHDIRTPMNAIVGFTTLLEKHMDDPERRIGYITKLKASGAYLLELLNNVLEMAYFEREQTTVDETVWNVEQFSDTIASVFRESMERKDLTFRREIQVEHPYVWCDATKVQQIFFNLMSNAVKYTPKGGQITMRLREEPSDRDGFRVYVTEIEDTGIGISKEFLPYLFEEFARERNTTQSKIGGTGLGLPIARKLVAILGGTISVKSQVGQGSCFTVTIPYRIASKETLEHSLEETMQQAEEQFAGKRVLMAEDNDLNAEIATEILEEMGFQVERAEDGAVCVEMFQKSEPGYYDLILMDIQMPNMDGYQATEHIRKMADERKDIPILAMTANTFEEDRLRAFAVGMNGLIAKPIDIGLMIDTLRSI